MFFRSSSMKTFVINFILLLIFVACAGKLNVPKTKSIKHLKDYTGLSVQANTDYWTSAGVQVEVGDKLLIMASKTVILWPNSNTKLPPSRALMVKIGDSDPMIYRSKFYMTISMPGELKFFIPDPLRCYIILVYGAKNA